MDSTIIEMMLGGNPLIITLVVIASSLIIIFKNELASLLDNIKIAVIRVLLQRRTRNRILSLLKHDIFMVIEDTRTACRHTKFYTHRKLDVTKTQMFVDFMNFKLDAIKKQFKLLINKAVDCEDNDCLRRDVIKAMYDAIDEYTEQTRVHFYKKGVPYDQADNCVDVFERWRLETVSSVSIRIDSVFSSKFHKSKYENLLAVLELISMAIALIPKDGVGAFNSINGKFKDINYNTN